MNTTRQLIVILVGTVVGTGAFAQEATSDAWMKVAPTLGRDAVIQELVQARADRSIESLGEAYNFVAQGAPGKSREQVRAELMAAKASGEFGALNAEVRGFDRPLPRLHASLGE